MNLQFLSIGNANGMQVAYFLDPNTKTVYMFRVVDATGNHTDSSFFVPPSTGGPVPVPMVYPDPLETSPQPRTDLPDKPRTIMPAGVAKMFQDGNETTMTPSGIQ